MQATCVELADSNSRRMNVIIGHALDRASKTATLQHRFKFWLCNAIFENYFRFSSFFGQDEIFSQRETRFCGMLRWSWAAKACTECCWLCLGKTSGKSTEKSRQLRFEVAGYGLPSKNGMRGSSFENRGPPSPRQVPVQGWIV